MSLRYLYVIYSTVVFPSLHYIHHIAYLPCTVQVKPGNSAISPLNAEYKQAYVEREFLSCLVLSCLGQRRGEERRGEERRPTWYIPRDGRLTSLSKAREQNNHSTYILCTYTYTYTYTSYGALVCIYENTVRYSGSRSIGRSVTRSRPCVYACTSTRYIQYNTTRACFLLCRELRCSRERESRVHIPR